MTNKKYKKTAQAQNLKLDQEKEKKVINLLFPPFEVQPTYFSSSNATSSCQIAPPSAMFGRMTR